MKKVRSISKLTCILGSSVLLLLTTSCASVKQNSVRTMDVASGGIVHNTLIVDLDVSETRVKGTAMGSKKSEVDQIKKDAIAYAVESVSADVLVEPRFKVEVVNARITVNVTGYPATFKNFRPITPADLELMKAGEAIQGKTSR